jgi:hypothetical protein
LTWPCADKFGATLKIFLPENAISIACEYRQAGGHGIPMALLAAGIDLTR